MYQNDGKRKIWTRKEQVHDPKLPHYVSDMVVAMFWHGQLLAANRKTLTVHIVDVTADRSS